MANHALRPIIPVRLISPLAAEAYMNPMLEAALWFWIPLCLIPVGIWLSISGKTKSLGKVIALMGLILVMISSWTVPDSDSSAVDTSFLL